MTCLPQSHHIKNQKIYEVKPEIEDSRNVVTLDHVSGNVEFDHVSFKLDGKQILSDISFSVKEGKTLGIMGATGSGKSSIINMLHRFMTQRKAPSDSTVWISEKYL